MSIRLSAAFQVLTLLPQIPFLSACSEKIKVLMVQIYCRASQSHAKSLPEPQQTMLDLIIAFQADMWKKAEHECLYTGWHIQVPCHVNLQHLCQHALTYLLTAVSKQYMKVSGDPQKLGEKLT